MGDIIHILPALTDLTRAYPHIGVDWVIEENFQEIPKLHPAIQHVIPIAIRRWRHAPLKAFLNGEIQRFYRALRAQSYDLILDAQGLIKSGLVSKIAKGPIAGFNRQSAREAWASLFYQDSFSVPRHLHAIERNRRLFSAVFGYQKRGPVDYGIDSCRFLKDKETQMGLNKPMVPSFFWHPGMPYAILLTVSSRSHKSWETENWITLGRRLSSLGLICVLPWGSPEEHTYAQQLTNAIMNAICPPRMSLTQAAEIFIQSHIVIGLDTGLIHLAAALSVPAIAIFCVSHPEKTGVRGPIFSANLGKFNQPPTVDEVWEAVQVGITSKAR